MRECSKVTVSKANKQKVIAFRWTSNEKPEPGILKNIPYVTAPIIVQDEPEHLVVLRARGWYTKLKGTCQWDTAANGESANPDINKC